MKPPLRVSGVLVGVLFGALSVLPAQAAPLIPASPGQNCAAGYLADPNSGNCWERAGSGGAPTIGGGPCMPGRIGTCIGYLANNPMSPGDTLPGASSWP